MGPKELPPEERGPSKTRATLGGKAPAPEILQVPACAQPLEPRKVLEALAARTRIVVPPPYSHNYYDERADMHPGVLTSSGYLDWVEARAEADAAKDRPEPFFRTTRPFTPVAGRSFMIEGGMRSPGIERRIMAACFPPRRRLVDRLETALHAAFVVVAALLLVYLGAVLAAVSLRR